MNLCRRLNWTGLKARKVGMKGYECVGGDGNRRIWNIWSCKWSPSLGGGSSRFGLLVSVKTQVGLSSTGRGLEMQQGALRENIHWTGEKWFCIFFLLPLIDSATVWAIFSLFHFLLFEEHISWEPFQNSIYSLGTKGLNLRQWSVFLLQQLRKTQQWPKKVVASLVFFDRNLLYDLARERCPVLFSHLFILYLLVKILRSSILVSFLITTDNETFHQKMGG